MRGRWVTLALAMGGAAVVTCSPPPELPPPAGARTDAAPHVDFDARVQTPSCADLRGRCVDPGSSCPIQITGKDPCGSTDAGPSSQICCTGGD
jgi:hypothetical protein